MRKFFSLIAAVLFAGSMMAADATMTPGTNGSTASVNGKDAVKCGTSKNSGDMTITVGAGATQLTLYAAAWKGVNGASISIATPDGVTADPASLALTADDGISNNSPFTLAGTEANFKFEVTLSGVGDGGATFTLSCAKRFVVWGAEYEAGEVPPVEPTAEYYLVGSFNDWTASADYKFAANTASAGEYMLEGVTLSAEDSIKVIGVLNEETTWYPDNAPNYVIAADGEYDIYFRPDGQGGEDWYYNCLYVAAVAPAEPTTCFDVYQMAKNDVVDLLNDVVVTFANGKNVWVRDGSASLLIYFTANTNYVAGDVLSGIAGTVDIYNGVTELKPSADQAAAIVATPGEAPAAIQTVVVEVADVNKYIVMPEVEFEAAAAFAEGTASNITMNGVTVRNNFKNGYAFEAGKKYNIYGVVTIYQNNPQIYFIDAEEAGEVAPKTAYYLVGSFNEWTASDDYKFVANAETAGEYMLEGVALSAEDSIKVIGVLNEETTWYPDNAPNYVIAADGEYNIYFRPDGQGGEDWYYNCLYVAAVVPAQPTTCAEVYQMAKNDVVDLLNDVTVTFANGKNVWVRDASASMLIFLPAASEEFSAGDVLSGIAGTVDIYNGVTEIKPSADQVAAIVATPGEAPAAEVVADVTVADVNKYIVMQEVEFDADAAFAEGSQSNITMNGVAVRNQFKNGYAFEAGKKYNIYGVVTIYNNNPQIYFIDAEEITPTAINNVAVEDKAVKVIREGQLFIMKNGVLYNAQGAIVK